jgi:hypothetical protein
MQDWVVVAGFAIALVAMGAVAVYLLPVGAGLDYWLIGP